MYESLNTVVNIMHIVGEDKDVEEVMEFIKSAHSDFDFFNIFPIPYIYKIEKPSYKGNLSSLLKVSQYDNILKNTTNRMSFKDWQIDTFGCEQVEDVEVVGNGKILFSSEYNIPFGVYRYLSSKFKNVKIRGYFTNILSGQSGITFYKKGTTPGIYTPSIDSEENYDLSYSINRGVIEEKPTRKIENEINLV